MKNLTASIFVLSALASPLAAQTLDTLLPSIVFTQTTILPSVNLCATVVAPAVCTQKQ